MLRSEPPGASESAPECPGIGPRVTSESAPAWGRNRPPGQLGIRSWSRVGGELREVNVALGRGSPTLRAFKPHREYALSDSATVPVTHVSAQITGETAEFRFADRTGATMLDPVLVLDPTDAGVQYVLMPLRA